MFQNCSNLLTSYKWNYIFTYTYFRLKAIRFSIPFNCLSNKKLFKKIWFIIIKIWPHSWSSAKIFKITCSSDTFKSKSFYWWYPIFMVIQVAVFCQHSLFSMFARILHLREREISNKYLFLWACVFQEIILRIKYWENIQWS